MSILWIVPWVLTIVAIIGWVINSKSSNYNWEFIGSCIGVVFSIFACIFHLVFITVPIDKSTYTILCPDSIARSDTHVMVSYKGEALISNEVRIYRAEDVDIMVRKTDGKNAYGMILEVSYYIGLHTELEQ